MQIKENTSTHPGKISLGVGRYVSGQLTGEGVTGPAPGIGTLEP